MVRAEKATAGPDGMGTRFRSVVRSAGRIVEMVIETTAYERPRLLSSTTTMEQMDVDDTLTLIAQRHGGLSEDDAAEYKKSLVAQKRYVRDVY